MSTSHIISSKCSKFECQSQKLSDAYVGVYGPISISMWESETIDRKQVLTLRIALNERSRELLSIQQQ